MKKFLLRLNLYFVIAILIHVTIVYGFHGRIYKIVGMSMFPTVMNGDKLYCLWTEQKIDRFDVVALEKESMPLIKRVIGMPGDTIRFTRRFVIVNNQPLRENFIFNNPIYDTNLSFTLGPDDYFVMGDNRDGSYDSRCFGPVKRREIVEALGFFIKL